MSGGRLATLSRHLLSIAILPFTVTVLVPLWIARENDVRLEVAGDALHVAARVAGVMLIVLGLVLAASTIRWFAKEGKGTLAPWDPPRELVVRGAYRYVRNPMISGVLLVVFGEALALWSRPHLWWALVVLAANLLYIPLVEEPALARRFGAPYEEYRRNVPRIVPRRRPWGVRRS
ncbi:MAG TPA: isoprenylcysteine carboxylmethyltransferase family protein [Longimicrobiales bacterium]|nr:isoprenylcysteine carboxylmethyltransferase family protein [Longimicrobiales bacterium]